MTSKGDSLKTNEFLRLRKLRLQQVREQSKDIAKKIRQRAKVEQLRKITTVDANKEKNYLQRQEKLINRLEQLYLKNLQNVGAGHKNACEINESEIPDKIDISKQRGKEAAAELKRKKQEKLNEQKKLLDRKLRAREVANVLSREKFAAVASTLLKSSSSKSIHEVHDKVSDVNEKLVTVNTDDKSDPVTKNDMGTQWEFDEIPHEWEPNIPTLPIPNDDSLKHSADNGVEKLDQISKHRRLNLFALSDEMPSSLRGGITSIPEDKIPTKPSLSLVSEYLQNRKLRLREPDTTHLQKNNPDDLQSIKQTLLRTRASKTDGSVFPNICHVLDEQVIPVPCWKAEKNCKLCPHSNKYSACQYKNWTINNKTPISRSICPCLSLCDEKLKAYQKDHNCHYGLKIPVSGRSNNVERSSNLDETSKVSKKKNSVTMYDHNTKDTRDLPNNLDKLVVRDISVDEDAYSQALKETSVIDNSIKSHHILQQETRNRLALTRQNVDKEYKDTLAFLNSLPKEKPARSIRTAFIDSDREQELKDRRQKKLQQEYKKIEKQSNKHQCKHVKNKIAAQVQDRSKFKSPVTVDIDNNIVNRDFQYSWLPIPESDNNMAIHSIPNTMKVDKSGNTVKFSSVDTYHEYRSRHKHTPPTKDVDNDPSKRVVEAVIIQENSTDTFNSTSELSTSSVENLQVGQDNVPGYKRDIHETLADAERIIIYKVVESKKSKNHNSKKVSLSRNNIVKNKESNNKNIGNAHQNSNSETNKPTDASDQIEAKSVSFSQLKEGVYKNVSANGDNIASLNFFDDQDDGKCSQDAKNTIIEEGDVDTNIDTRTNSDEKNLNRITKSCAKCQSNSHKHSGKNLSTGTSTSSFKTAVNDKTNNVLHDDRFIKFVDDDGQDSGKFYVGASGFLKDEAYEVIIQLRKKEAEKKNKNVTEQRNSSDIGSTGEKKNEDRHYLRQQLSVVQSIEQIIDSSKNLSGLEKEKLKSPEKEKPELLSTKTDVKIHEQIVPATEVSSPNKIKEVGSKQEKSTIEPPDIIDKGNSTMFRDSFAIPDNMPKLDPISKPAASVYTQTTQNISVPKPLLMHLSSSTSTTYMSPPELVLPRYLRKYTSESGDDTYEPISNNYNSQNIRYRCCKVCCKKRNKGASSYTPPNTARSDNQNTGFVNKEQIKKCLSGSRHKTVRAHKCKNLDNRSDPKIASKQKFKRSSSENKRLHSGSNCSTLSNNKNKVTNKNDKVSLNPVIENYVKKLLALNKEGLKAVEIVNQECSAVDTPSSSIINVPSNIMKKKDTMCNKISLEQIKNSLKEQILNSVGNSKRTARRALKSIGSQTEKNIHLSCKSNKRRTVHKVKSFNISKQFIKTNRVNRRQSTHSTVITTSPCTVYSHKENYNFDGSSMDKSNSRSENSPTPRQMNTNRETSNNSSNSEVKKVSEKSLQNREKSKICKRVSKITTCNKHYPSKSEICPESESNYLPSHKATILSQSSVSQVSNDMQNRRTYSTPPISISTQTNQVDSEVEFMKLAENKLQNMEKIADLTEKCTKRLSNLAKVLEEVRRNKSLVYSQVSSLECTSDSDQRSDKNVPTSKNRVKSFNPTVEIQTLTEALSSMPTSPEDLNKHDVNDMPEYMPVLLDLPKPGTLKTPSPLSFSNEKNESNLKNFKEQCVKNRGKPPPALTRVNLKHVPEGFIIPHELSTVVEVDSPMSVKLKSYTTQIDNKYVDTNIENVDNIHLDKVNDSLFASNANNKLDHPNIISKLSTSKSVNEKQAMSTSEDLKIKMMDLTHFNEIMLKPFISLKDYAKQYNLEGLDGQLSINGNSRDENINEELSSLHSEASLPDIMAELLKRNLISEPFKFETTSNVNSTTVSSESTLSLLALSKAQNDKKKSAMLVKDKENMGETSVSLSISSNPDLEHAFQRLGMGWASSTLKKTKERLALSSSSNTSSSSIPHFKLKSFNYQDIPDLSSLLNISNKDLVKQQGESINETPKNALQQTSLTNSMTVKEFLANELASKITFSNKTNRNTTEDEFMSLCETKIPEEMKNLPQKAERNEKSTDSLPSGINNRARTSTPVQIFKSMTYHSTSSSNTSNGLFSNADDLSSVKGTSNSIKNHSTSDKDDLTIPNYSLKMRKAMTESSKSD